MLSLAERSNIGVALLAAGSSRRFGAADKLAAEFDGFMLGQNASFAFPIERVRCAWVIVAALGHPCEPGWRAMGFDPVVNPDAAQGMGTSVALAARLAQRAQLGALAIALADMPLVPARHYEALIDAVAAPEDIATSALREARMPPAVFGSAHFAELAQLGGDTGARGLLARGRIVPCPEEWLADIDTPDALARLS
jgi:CTP:molybdopterin cytidylyltransferase MocA